MSHRNFSIKEGKRQKRVHDKIEKSTSDQAVDPTTRLLLFKMINNGYLESIHGIISTGKEAIIIYADGGPGKTSYQRRRSHFITFSSLENQPSLPIFFTKNELLTKWIAMTTKFVWPELHEDFIITFLSPCYFFTPGPDDAEVPLNIPKEVAIKVFKTTLNEFKNREKYIRDDYRFRDRFSKQNPRKVIEKMYGKTIIITRKLVSISSTFYARFFSYEKRARKTLMKSTAD
jgi:serine/threonine-protein kinase RIO1